MKKGDILLIVITAVFLVLCFMPQGGGDEVEISVNGELYKKASLDEDRVISISTEFGENTVVIENGEVYITDSDCPDKLCEKQKINNDGGSIVCLPNRVSIVIEGKKQKEKIDVII